MGWRAFIFGLLRHRATSESGVATYSNTSSDEWLNITHGQVNERKVDPKSGDVTERYTMVDPSDALSFEEIARPSARVQALEGEENDDLKGLGCGNVARISKSKYISNLGAALTYRRLGFHPDRVQPLHIMNAL